MRRSDGPSERATSPAAFFSTGSVFEVRFSKREREFWARGAKPRPIIGDCHFGSVEHTGFAGGFRRAFLCDSGVWRQSRLSANALGVIFSVSQRRQSASEGMSKRSRRREVSGRRLSSRCTFPPLVL